MFVKFPFITQILEKSNIATNSEHDEIIENLIASKSTKLVGNMLTPNNYSIELVDFIKEYIPEFYTKDYFYETLEKIEDTARTGIGLEGLKSEFMRMFDEAFTKAGYEFADKKPSQNKINYAMKLAKKYGVILSDEELNSNIKLDIFIAQFPEKEEIKLGTCTKYNSAVYQREWIKDDGEALTYFACENLKSIENKCSFSIWDSYIYKFFSPKGIELIMSLFGFSRLNRTAQILWFI